MERIRAYDNILLEPHQGIFIKDTILPDTDYSNFIHFKNSGLPDFTFRSTPSSIFVLILQPYLVIKNADILITGYHFKQKR